MLSADAADADWRMQNYRGLAVSKTVDYEAVCLLTVLSAVNRHTAYMDSFVDQCHALMSC
jgi:hypothetical protein